MGPIRHSTFLGFRRRNTRCGKIGLVVLVGGLILGATPAWKAPPDPKFGDLLTLELREEEPSKPTLPRPRVEDRLGPLRIRSMEPLADGRGWRFQVQALEPGLAVIPALDLGNGQRSPECRLWVPRTIPFGGPWMGYGGGKDDRLPDTPLPWAWASILLVPPLTLFFWGLQHWRKGAVRRRLRRALQIYQRQWPPVDRARSTLDAVHALGRDLLAARFGEPARAWGPADFQAQDLRPWDLWAQSLDAARFGRTEPPFPALEALLAALGDRNETGKEG
jgi:hypothetical protein